MSLLGWAGVVWLVDAVFGLVITFVFRTEPIEWIVSIIASVAAAIVGVLIIWRPARSIVTWAGVVGVVWLVVYAWLTYSQRGEPAAWTTDLFLGVLGVIAAALSLTRSARQG